MKIEYNIPGKRKLVLWCKFLFLVWLGVGIYLRLGVAVITVTEAFFFLLGCHSSLQRLAAVTQVPSWLSADRLCNKVLGKESFLHLQWESLVACGHFRQP